MKRLLVNRLSQAFIIILPLVTGCSVLHSKQPLNITYYSLDAIENKAQADQHLSQNNTLPTLIIHMPNAAAGFDTRRMAYTRSLHQLEYFARNEWIDTPARMVQPLMISAIEKTLSFNAVIPKLAAAKTDLRLESEILSLLQDFHTKPSTIRFNIRATIINNATGKIIALREFDEVVVAVSDDPIGGVKAANEAVNIALKKLSVFCAEAAANWK